MRSSCSWTRLGSFRILFSLALVLPLPSVGHTARSLDGTVVVTMQAQLAQMWFGDLNRLIRDQHSGFITSEPNAALSQVTGGVGFDLGAEYGLGEDWLAGLTAEMLLPSTEVRIGSWAWPDRMYTIDLKAYAFGAQARKTWWWGDEVLLSAGAGLFYLGLWDAGESRKVRAFWAAMHTTDALDYRGGALGGLAFGAADLFFLPWGSVGLEVGYRYARIGTVTGVWQDGTSGVLRNPDGSNFSLDYGGFFVKGGFKIWM